MMIEKLASEFPKRELTPEHIKRGSDHNSIDVDNFYIHPEVTAAYKYVDSVLDTSSFKDEYLWHGWAIREAFLAGCSHNAANINQAIEPRSHAELLAKTRICARLMRKDIKAAEFIHDQFELIQKLRAALAHTQEANTIKAMPIAWTKDGDTWNETQYGFHIYIDTDEPLERRYSASWGEDDAEYFPSLEEAQYWCQDRIDIWIESVAIGQPLPVKESHKLRMVQPDFKLIGCAKCGSHDVGAFGAHVHCYKCNQTVKDDDHHTAITAWNNQQLALLSETAITE